MSRNLTVKNSEIKQVITGHTDDLTLSMVTMSDVVAIPCLHSSTHHMHDTVSMFMVKSYKPQFHIHNDDASFELISSDFILSPVSFSPSTEH